MKKTLLTLSMLGAFAVSSSAMAAFADASKGEGAGAGVKLSISGVLTNTNPNWMWDIPSKDTAAVKNVALKMIQGVVNNQDLTFKLNNGAPIEFLQGYMKTPSATSGAGIQPEITVAGVKLSNAREVPISVDVNESGTKVGVMNATWASQVMVYMLNAVDHNRVWNGPKSLNPKADEVLSTNQADFKTTYGNGIAGSTNDDFNYQWNILSNYAGSTKVSAGYYSELKDVKLVFPISAPTPTTWAASIPVTISLK